MSRLAEQFGVSGNGLAKICRRLEVSYPPRGWWAKKEAGKAVKIASLTPAKPGVPLQATIYATSSISGGLKAEIQQKRDELGELVVPMRLTNAHPLIASWIEDRRRRMEVAKRERDPWRRSHYAVSDFTMADRRRHRILQALFNALEQYGATIAKNDRHHLVATISDEQIEFSLEEKSRQVTRPLTAEEKRWGTWAEKGVRTELEPTGLMHFSIKAWTEQPIRKNWTESDRRPLEGMLAEIAATFLVLAPMLAERSRVRREEARKFAERQRQFELERERRQQDANRWTRFMEIAEEWQRIDVARRFLAKLKELDLPETDLIDGLSLSEWLAWAEERARASNPVDHGVDHVFSDIAKMKAWSFSRR